METNKLTVVVALGCVFMLASCFIVLGASSIDLMKKLNMDGEQFGFVMAFFLYSAMVIQFFIGSVTDKFGHKPIAILGFVATAVADFLIAGASTYSMLLVAAPCLGIGAMCMNTVGNTIIPQVLFGGKDPARASNFGNAFFGMGLFVTPLIITYSPRYEVGLWILELLSVVFLIVALLAKYPKAALGYRFSTGFKLLGQAPVLIAALALMCYVGLENAMSAWIKPLMTDIAGGGEGAARTAGLVLSLFGISMTIGRFATSAIKNLTAIGVKLIIVVAAVSALILFVLTATDSVAVSILCVILIGLAFAPVFPTVVGVTFDKYEPKYYGSIFGMIFAIGLFGGGLVQNLIGRIAGDTSVQAGLKVPAVVSVILLVIALLMGKTKAKPVED